MSSVSDAFALLRSTLETSGIRFAVGGSWASTAFGEPRFTNDVDIVADLTPANLTGFLIQLPATFYVDHEGAKNAIRLGRPFNAIYMPIAFKFDFFPARAFLLGMDELNRSISITGTGLSEAATPFVTPEDILLAKLYWFRSGGEVSEVQWRDIQGLVRARGSDLDTLYLDQGAQKLGLHSLLKKAISQE